jgi:hypothetical protein
MLADATNKHRGDDKFRSVQSEVWALQGALDTATAEVDHWKSRCTTTAGELKQLRAK